MNLCKAEEGNIFSSETVRYIGQCNFSNVTYKIYIININLQTYRQTNVWYMSHEGRVLPCVLCQM